MESSPDRENSQGTTESRVADDSVHKHGTQEVSSAEDAAAAASSVRGALGRMSAQNVSRKYDPKSGHAFIEHLDFVRGRRARDPLGRHRDRHLRRHRLYLPFLTLH